MLGWRLSKAADGHDHAKLNAKQVKAHPHRKMERAGSRPVEMRRFATKRQPSRLVLPATTSA